MTGRNLYDRYCDATKQYVYLDAPLVAWPYLSYNSQRRWRSMAAAITNGKRFA